MPHSARFVGAAAGVDQLAVWKKFRHPEIAFAGRSNVGKSSLLNRLVGHSRLARVSKTPGRTQQINLFVVDDRLTFVDLPGYGFARVPIAVKQQWKQLVEGYLNASGNLRAVVVLIDLRRGVQADDALLLEFLSVQRIAALVVATKADKLAYGERLRQSRVIETELAEHGIPVIICSAVTGQGISELWQQIQRHAGGNEARSSKRSGTPGDA